MINPVTRLEELMKEHSSVSGLGRMIVKNLKGIQITYCEEYAAEDETLFVQAVSKAKTLSFAEIALKIREYSNDGKRPVICYDVMNIKQIPIKIVKIGDKYEVENHTKKEICMGGDNHFAFCIINEDEEVKVYFIRKA